MYRTLLGLGMLSACILFTSPVMAANALTLSTAVQIALTHSPRLQSAKAAQAASQGERQQAELWQNPEIEITAENLAGNGAYKGLGSAEITYGVSQPLEIGGKRSARTALAQYNVSLAEYDYQAVALDVVRETTVAFIEAVAAGEEAGLARQQQKLAAEMLKSVSERVNAAREPLIQKSKANVALATSRITLEKAERAQDAARKGLANLIGSQSDAFTLDTTAFYTVTSPQHSASLQEKLARTPDSARWRAAVSRSKAAMELEQANAVPNPRLSAGVRDFRDTGDKALVAGISIPFPAFGRNEGNIAKARAEISKSMSDQQAGELTLVSELERAVQGQRAAYVQATTLQKELLPEAEKAFSQARQGYSAGKFSYLEVLDAERTLAEARLQHIVALKEYHTQRANIDRLTASNLPEMKTEESHEK